MTSKHSFLTSLKSNAKRRLGLFILMGLYFVLSYPFLTAVLLNSEKMSYVMKDLGYHLGIVFGSDVVGFSIGSGIWAGILGVGAAIQGFAYMFSKKKLDFYMSVPVKKERHFWTVYLNGLLSYVVFYAINLLLAFPVAKVCGATTTTYAMVEAAWGFMLNTAIFFASYNLGILAVMLTGNVLVAIAASCVLMLYDQIVVLIMTGCNHAFFNSYVYDTDDFLQSFVVSPFGRSITIYSNCYSCDWSTMYRTLSISPLCQNLACLLAFGIVVLALDLFTFGKKPAEACGKCLAFPIIRGALKVMLLVPASIGFGILCYTMAGSSKPFLVVGAIIGLLIGHFVIEIIYEFDIHIFKNGWKSGLLSCIFVVAIVLTYLFDLIGYDRFVPDPSKVASVSFQFDDEYYNYYDENLLNDISFSEYVKKNMAIPDATPVCALATLTMGINPVDADCNQYRTCVVCYHMANGHDVYRTFPVSYRENLEYVDAIFAQPEYKEKTSLAFCEGVNNHWSEMNVTCYNGVHSVKLDAKNKDAILEAYRADYKDMTYTERVQNLQVANIQIQRISKDQYFYETVPVYKGFDRTLAIMKANGLDCDTYLNAKEVKRLVIKNYHYENNEENGDYENAEQDDVEVIYTDSDEIAAIVPYLYPSEFCCNWTPTDFTEDSYDVSVFFDSDICDDAGNYNYGCNYCFFKGKVPAFVVEQTAYNN